MSLLAALALAGCAADAGPAELAAETRHPIPLPPPALLAAPKQPSCEQSAKGQGSPSDEAQADANLAERLRLEFERDCYKAAEAQTRVRLAKLQAAARATAQALKRDDRARALSVN